MRIPSFLFFLILITLFDLFINCNSKTIPSAEINFISDKEGTITMRSIGLGQNKEEAIINAEENAFNVLLFRGLPESTQKMALVGPDEASLKEAHKQYFDQLFSGKRYRTFLMSSIPSELMQHYGGRKSIAVDVKINATALRRDLEQRNIIRKFGF